MACRSVVQHGMLMRAAVWFIVMLCSVVCCGLAWRGVVGCGVWCSVVFNMVRCSVA